MSPDSQETSNLSKIDVVIPTKVDVLIECTPNDLMGFLSRRMSNILRIEQHLKELEDSILSEPVEKMTKEERLSLLSRLSDLVLEHIKVTSKVMSQVNLEEFMRGLGLLEIFKKVKDLDPEAYKRMLNRFSGNENGK